MPRIVGRECFPLYFIQFSSEYEIKDFIFTPQMAGYSEQAPHSKHRGEKKRKRDSSEKDDRVTRKRSRKHKKELEHEADGIEELDDAREPEIVNGTLTAVTLRVEHPSKEVDDLGAAIAKTAELADYSADDGDGTWTISRPMGGRISNIDPILTQDDR